MKFTTSAALAAAATGVAAQNNWNAWSSSVSSTTKSASSAASTSKTSSSSSSSSCPAPSTSVKTETTTAYQSTYEIYKSTVTVPIPDKPASVSVKNDWVDWDATTDSATNCVTGKVITKTSTITSVIPGTTTVTKSIMFVGAQVSDSPDAAWNNWNSNGNSDSSSSSSSSNGNGNGNGNNNNNGNAWSNNGNSNSNNNNNGNSNSNSNNGNGNNGWNNGNNNGGSTSGGKSSSKDGSNNNNGNWGQGSWGGSGTGGKQAGSGNQVFQWGGFVPTNTKSGVAPTYTPDGKGGYSGTPWGGAGDWNDWNPSNGDSKNGTTGGKNSTNPISNGTLAEPGSVGSNVTKPFQPLKDSSCNTAADRSKWCGNLDINTDYYQDYFNDAGSSSSQAFGGYGGFTGGKCSYNLQITNGTWNQDGKDVMTFLINGQYPGPAIECNWGDLVEITVTNNLQGNGTAIHWHGIRQVGTNDQDGVPGVTECAIAPGTSRTYTWRASSYGTSWYHSHWGLQYGDGVAGPIIIHGPATANYDIDAGTVMLADTFGMPATAFGSIIAHVGPQPVNNYLLNGKNTQVDLSAGQHSLWKVKSGKKYLFRLINSAAQNMYSVSIDQHKMTVIAADFVPITPYTTEWVNIGIGQRYDVIVDMDQKADTYFFRAVTQTLCPSGSINSGLGQANGMIAYDDVPLYLPTSTINGGKIASDFAICNDEPLASLVPHLKKGAGTKSAFQASASTLPAGTVSLVNTADDGAVFRWFLNNGAMYINYTQPTIKSLNEGFELNNTAFANLITLNQKNQWVYFAIQNQFFAFHPMHLHGHDFSVLGQGDGLFTADLVDTLNFDNPARRDTAMLRGAASPAAASGGYTVIGFETDNPGAWLMHCHIAWHVDGGLAVQWLERPDDMKASPYTNEQAFNNECSAYASYEASNPSGAKFSGQSGLRKREATYFDRMVKDASRQFNTVVRREEHAAHHFLEGHLKRGLGDGAHRRTFGRRR